MTDLHALRISLNNHLSQRQNSVDQPVREATIRLKDVSHVTRRDLPAQQTPTRIALAAGKGTSCKVLDPPREKIHDLQVTWGKILPSCAFRVITLVIRDFRREKKDVRYVR